MRPEGVLTGSMTHTTYWPARLNVAPAAWNVESVEWSQWNVESMERGVACVRTVCLVAGRFLPPTVYPEGHIGITGDRTT